MLGPESQPLDVGRTHRRPPRWMRRAIVARDRGCRFPGCDLGAGRCEAHHVEAWELGGATAVTNLLLLCPFHHHLIHRRRWRTTFDGDTFTVTDPDDRLTGTICAPPRDEFRRAAGSELRARSREHGRGIHRANGTNR